MRNCVVFLALVTAVAFSSPVVAQTTEETMYVSVFDGNSRPVTGLGVPDFIVKEDGMTREVLRAGRTADPMDLAVVVDNSQGLQSYVNDVRTATAAFVRRMADRQSASVALIGMADRPTGIENYTESVAVLEKAVKRIFPQPGAGTVLQDTIVETVKGLVARGNARRAIVVITTEAPDFSNVPYEHTLEVLRSSGAGLHVLVIAPRGGAPLRDDQARDRAYLIDQGPRATGGSRQDLLTSMTLGAALDRVGDDLASQYKVVYARPGSLFPPKTLEVAVKRAGSTARGTLVRSKSGA
jgi:VWFA-related protein